MADDGDKLQAGVDAMLAEVNLSAARRLPAPGSALAVADELAAEERLSAASVPAAPPSPMVRARASRGRLHGLIGLQLLSIAFVSLVYFGWGAPAGFAAAAGVLVIDLLWTARLLAGRVEVRP